MCAGFDIAESTSLRMELPNVTMCSLLGHDFNIKRVIGRAIARAIEL